MFARVKGRRAAVNAARPLHPAQQTDAEASLKVYIGPTADIRCSLAQPHRRLTPLLSTVLISADLRAPLIEI
jgi:hypothetical protein